MVKHLDTNLALSYHDSVTGKYALYNVLKICILLCILYVLSN